MGNTKFAFILFIVFSGAAAAGWWIFIASNPEGKIMSSLQEGKRAVEAEDIEAAISLVSTGYSDERGFTYLVLKRLLRDAFAEFDDFEVEWGPAAVTLPDGGEDRALAAVDTRVFVTLGGKQGILVGTLDEPAHLEIFFVKKPWGWFVSEIRGFRTPFSDL